jgi:hypothetical protein
MFHSVVGWCGGGQVNHLPYVDQARIPDLGVGSQNVTNTYSPADCMGRC